MKNFWFFGSLILLTVLTDSPLFAREGRKDGGERRTPSMSRADNRAEGHAARINQREQQRGQQRSSPQPQARVQEGRSGGNQRRFMSPSPSTNRPQFTRQVQGRQEARVNRGGVERTPSLSSFQGQVTPKVQNRENIRDVINQYRNRKPFYGDVSKVPKERRDNVRAALPEKFQKQRQTASHIRDNIGRRHPEYRDWFSSGFFDRHNFSDRHHFRGNPWRRWRWRDLNSWLGYGWGYPYYYNYGYPVELSGYENDPALQVSGYDQAAAPIEGNEWVSLGVFAAGKNESQAAYSDMFVQLAIDKQGTLQGAYYNTATDQVYALEGYVDQQTQGVFWRLSDKDDSPLMSTGVFNLTQDVVPVTVTFSPSNEQNWVLVRVNE